MKKIKKLCFGIVTFLGICVLLLNTLTSCDGFFDKINQRISGFETDLNNTDRSGLYLNFHPDETASYDQIKNPEFFSGSPLSEENIPFSITDLSTPADQGSGRMLVAGTLSNTNMDFPAHFIMLEYGNSWYIEELILLDAPGGVEDWAVRKIQ